MNCLSKILTLHIDENKERRTQRKWLYTADLRMQWLIADQSSIYQIIPHHWKKDPRAHLDNPQDARRLAELYPGQVSIVKYEEVARKPKITLPIILKVPKSFSYKTFLNINWLENEKRTFPFQFLGLPWHPSLTKFMADHMVEDAK